MQGMHVFLSGERGVEVLRTLLSSRHNVESVIVPAGKVPSNLSSLLKSSRIELQEVADVNSSAFVTQMAKRVPNIFIVAGYSTIFRSHLFSVPTLGTINLHGGRVPQYRGGSPLNWQIINGESSIGISILRMDAGIDDGPILAETTFALADRDDIAAVHAKANKLFGPLLLEALDKLEGDSDCGRAQAGNAGTYWHQRSDVDGEIAFETMTASQVERFVRALTRPYPGAYGYAGGHRVRIFRCELPAFDVRGNPGRVCWISGQGPLVICNGGAVRVTDYEFLEAPQMRLSHGLLLGRRYRELI